MQIKVLEKKYSIPVKRYDSLSNKVYFVHKPGFSAFFAHSWTGPGEPGVRRSEIVTDKLNRNQLKTHHWVCAQVETAISANDYLSYTCCDTLVKHLCNYDAHGFVCRAYKKGINTI